MIRLAESEDAHLVHHCMIAAFEEYRQADVPSSALNEAVSSIEESLRNGSERALLYLSDEIPWGSVRFKVDDHGIYFSRLSVCPEARGRGIATSMLAWLENYAIEQGKSRVWCRVRMSVPQNIQLYASLGFQVYKEEVVTNPNGFPVKTVLMEKEI
ncbi:GNAT family N-acetyltransferase [Paenibacillus mendelii]|uniref:GNAT family N-acetyltransferase n=1 Tax=Paenibacillus mendelii TaxID=206163 RepID=A0ABV6J6I7_9BACL|nr:GNAT family N-acetyltransferase [Paenibacillus mendelii]MCQ6561228.1 GNAT family N-acetyltransferase [Paenibacillus mendelii]